MFGIEIDVAMESEPAGTGGALKRAANRLEDAFFLLNGDPWLDFNLLDMAARLMERPSATGIIALRWLDDPTRYGSVELSDERILAFHAQTTQTGRGLVSGGVYALRKSIVDALDMNCSLERDAFPPLALDGRLLGRVFDGYFIDIGIPTDLARRSAKFLRAGARPHSLIAMASSTMTTAMSDQSQDCDGSPAHERPSSCSIMPVISFS